ncbi:MAG: RDD family protein [Janthinobacterium lividum]
MATTGIERRFAPLTALIAPSIARRLLCMVYEGVILFGVVFAAGLAFALLTQQRNALWHRHALTAWLAFVVGIYFVVCFTRGGQTLPMKTWRIRLVGADQRPISPMRAACRYLLGWLWWFPPLALYATHTLSLRETLLAFGAWLICWALTARFDSERQFLHDRLAGTRLVELPVLTETATKKRRGGRVAE